MEVWFIAPRGRTDNRQPTTARRGASAHLGEGAFGVNAVAPRAEDEERGEGEEDGGDEEDEEEGLFHDGTFREVWKFGGLVYSSPVRAHDSRLAGRGGKADGP